MDSSRRPLQWSIRAREAEFVGIDFLAGLFGGAGFEAGVAEAGFLEEAAGGFVPGEDGGVDFVNGKVLEDVASEGGNDFAHDAATPELLAKPETEFSGLHGLIWKSNIDTASGFALNFDGEMAAGRKCFGGFEPARSVGGSVWVGEKIAEIAGDVGVVRVFDQGGGVGRLPGSEDGML